jgi:beta-barrel assembly-enhancing protease
MGNIMSQISRRHFIQAGLAGSAIYAGKTLAFDIGGILGKAAPYLQHAQPLIEAMTFNEADEIKMGESFYPQYIKKSGGAYADDKLQTALIKFATPFVKTSKRQNLNWDIVLLKNKEVNAWALPGGKVAINSGLLSYTKDPAELASVIAHEMGHIELSHGIAQMKTKAFTSSLSGAGKQALTDFGGAGGAISSQLLSSIEGPLFDLVNKGYSRKNEFEADAFIMSVFKNMGLDKHKADDFFVTLNKLYPSDSTITTSLFSTHPVTQERVNKLEELAKQQESVVKNIKMAGWNELKEAFPNKKIA